MGFEQFSQKSIRAKIAASPLATNKKAAKVQLSVLTNSTYDGVIYNAEKVKSLLAGSARFLLFDEAWYAYAAFHPFYEHRYAMSLCFKRRGHYPPVHAQAAAGVFAVFHASFQTGNRQ